MKQNVKEEEPIPSCTPQGCTVLTINPILLFCSTMLRILQGFSSDQLEMEDVGFEHRSV